MIRHPIKIMSMTFPTFRYYYSGGSGSAGDVGDGQLLIGNSSGTPVIGNIQAGPGISIDNGPGSITVTALGTGSAYFETFDVNDVIPFDNAMVLNTPKKIGFNNLQTNAEQFSIETDGTITYIGTIPRHMHTGTSLSIECDTQATIIKTYWRQSTDGGTTYTDINGSKISLFYANNGFGQPTSTASHSFWSIQPGDKFQLWVTCSKACNLRMTYFNAFGMAMM